LPSAFANPKSDRTHHNNYGAYQLAKAVVQGVADSGLPLADAMVDGFDGFNPDDPDEPESFEVASSPERRE